MSIVPQSISTYLLPSALTGQVLSFLSVLLFLSLTKPVSAQQLPIPSEGSLQIRLTHPSEPKTPIRGILLSADSTAIIVQNRSQDTLRFIQEEILKLEVRKRSGSYWKLGVLAGLVPAVVFASTSEATSGSGIGTFNKVSVLVGGGLIGGLIGRFVPRKSWRAINPLQLAGYKERP